MNRSSRKAQQNGNSNKRVKYSNSKVKQEPFVKQEESEEDDDEDGAWPGAGRRFRLLIRFFNL